MFEVSKLAKQIIRQRFGKSPVCIVYGHEREYKVLLAKRPDRDQIEAWKRGVMLEDGYRTQPVEARYDESRGKGAWMRVVMREGRKRQIRETCRQLALHIVRILRIRIGTLRLGSLKPR